jgi:hypothetical protein
MPLASLIYPNPCAVDGTVEEKMLAYNRANREVAILCNHQVIHPASTSDICILRDVQRAAPKSHDAQMEKLAAELEELQKEVKEAKKELKQLKSDVCHNCVRCDRWWCFLVCEIGFLSDFETCFV